MAVQGDAVHTVEVFRAVGVGAVTAATVPLDLLQMTERYVEVEAARESALLPASSAPQQVRDAAFLAA